MTFQGDPFRTLGIAPSASLNEIRSAYRRLAKQYHPDAAGDRALPRFLAIQAAYERLVDSEGRLRPPPGGTGFVVGAAQGAVARGFDAGEGVARGVAGASGRRVDGGRRPETGRDAGRRRERRGAWAPGRAATARPAARGRGAAARAPHAPRLPEGDPGLHDLRRGRRRAARPGVGGRLLVRPVVADVLDDQPARVCRSAEARPRVPGAGTTRGAGRGGRNVGGGRVGRSVGRGRCGDPRHRRGPVRERGRRRGARRGSRRARLGLERLRVDDHRRRGRRLGDARLGLRGGAPTTPRRDGPGGGRAPRPTTSAREVEPLPDLEAVARRAAPANLLALARRPGWRWRLAIALIAWPPVGYGVGTLLATVTGCAQFSASCPEPLPLLSLAVQPLVVAALFALPPAAAVGAFATIVVVRRRRARGGGAVGGPGSERQGRCDPARGRRHGRVLRRDGRGGDRGLAPAPGPRGAGPRPDPAPRPSRAIGRHPRPYTRAHAAPPRPRRHLGRRPGVPARAARDGLRRPRRDHRPARPPRRGDHPGRERDVPPARRGRARRARDGPRPRADRRGPRRRGRDLPPPRAARVAADLGRRA